MSGFKIPFGKFTVVPVGGYGGTPVTGSCQLCDYGAVKPVAVMGYAVLGAAIKVICPQCGHRETLAEFVIKQPAGSTDLQEWVQRSGEWFPKDTLKKG